MSATRSIRRSIMLGLLISSGSVSAQNLVCQTIEISAPGFSSSLPANNASASQLADLKAEAQFQAELAAIAICENEEELNGVPAAVRKGAFKLATLLHSMAMTDLPVPQFKSTDNVAEAINDLCGVEAVTGAELDRAYRRGHQPGTSPPRQSRPPFD